ncbi:hypothetical protein AB0I81_12005 [Nonomuraea sp. NPDC050404]|uniref:hypothetical protein n=1 Tax=Nonomuraea sp. NPDC050404 TaxID=3155783 RepID=UPI0033E98D21
MRVLSSGLTVLIMGVVCVSSMPVRASVTPQAMAVEGELLEFAWTYLKDRAARLTSRPAHGDRRGLTRVPVGAALRERLAADAAAIDRRRERLRAVNGGHRGSRVTVRDTKFRHEGDTVVTLYLTEVTELFFSRTGTSGPPGEAYGLNHRFAFHKAGGSWLIAETEPGLTPGGLAPDTYP